jgi:phosphatidate cytidylyltransferase
MIGPWLMEGQSPKVSILICCLYGATIALAGIVGDLFESLLKRDAEAKDSSQWLPGLGGILDILDSVYAAAPVSFVWWVSGVLG